MWAGLTDLHIKIPMGITAENLAEKYQITREEVDNYAYQTQQRWKAGKMGFLVRYLFDIFGLLSNYLYYLFLIVKSYLFYLQLTRLVTSLRKLLPLT